MVRLLAKRHDEPYLLLYSVLGFVPRDIKYYNLSLRHKSLRPHFRHGHQQHNERLEFLGDAVLGAIVADILYKRFPTKPEGFLTNIRSRIVRHETLNRIALALGLDKLVHTAKGQNNRKHNIFGNAVEALIGAIYLDQGYEVCYDFVKKKIINPFVNIEKIAQLEVNFKSKLLEHCQRNKKELIYELVERRTDEKKNPIFLTRILIQGEEISQGFGESKKKSEQEAAKTALKKIKNRFL